MGAPCPDLCNLWLARAFNAQDVDAAAARYQPEAWIVQVDEVHGGTSLARGSDVPLGSLLPCKTRSKQAGRESERLGHAWLRITFA